MPFLVKLILGRVLLGLLTLFLVSLVVFAATQALPGNPASVILGRNAANPAEYQALRTELKLNRPLYEQYSGWLGGILRGNFGYSLAERGTKVTTLLRPRIVNSAILVFFAALLSIPLSMALGALSAVWRDSKFDSFVNTCNLGLAALPEFVIGILLVLLFATQVFKWLPSVSSLSPGVSYRSQMSLFILPMVTLALAVVPYITRMLRASMIEVLESEYVMMAGMKGLSRARIVWRHALPNAVGPTAQVVAINLAWLAGGIVTVEYLFGFPGIGAELVDAVSNRDMPVIQALCILIAALYVVFNLAADIVTILANPRLRTGQR